MTFYGKELELFCAHNLIHVCVPCSLRGDDSGVLLLMSSYCFDRLQDYPVGSVGPKDVSVEIMMCAINPADINQIQGKQISS